ncbi:hypothetical protein L195_g039442 [Trifolium pratense]|uniref:Uncharacterized protein n=1 Tax=Trifolium pratense TaxID=57577 RepID=A0A2K3LXY6_TRIPR|nr:hypothetical protein L195_g039442 [Trifolium pratense]
MMYFVHKHEVRTLLRLTVYRVGHKHLALSSDFLDNRRIGGDCGCWKVGPVRLGREGKGLVKTGHGGSGGLVGVVSMDVEALG